MSPSARPQPSSFPYRSGSALQIAAVALVLALLPPACAKTADTDDGSGSSASGWTTSGSGGGSGGSGGTISTSSGTGGTTSSSGTGGCGGTAYSHTITIDGVNDFIPAAEELPTSTVGYNAYISWDSQYLYLGLSGTNLGTPSDSKWVLVYIGGSNGLTVGQTYQGQTPNLPFSALYHWRWKGNNTYTNAQVVSGGAWVEAGWTFTGDVYLNPGADFLEMRIPLANISWPNPVQVHMSMIDEDPGVNFSWAAVPHTSFTDGPDPDYTKYYELDLCGSAAPSSYQPLP